jgi:hypothetical protein
MMDQPDAKPDVKVGPAPRRRDPRSLHGVLHALVGKIAVVSHPEAIKKTPLGHQLKHGFYRGKITWVKEDLIAIVVESPADNGCDSAGCSKLLVPTRWIKLVGISKEEIHLHI